MSLATLLSGEFKRQVRERGHDYYRSGRVRITSGSDRHVEAIVRGSEPYAVELGWEGDDLKMSCDCLAFDEDNCKHLWATILAADAGRYLSAMTAPVPPPPPPSRWQKQLAALQDVLADRPRQTWPERRQLLYAIDVPASASDGTLKFGLLTRERSKNGKGWNMSKELRWQRRDIALLPEAVDREVLSALDGGKEYGHYTSGDWGELPRAYRVPHLLAVRLVPLICASGRCFLRSSASRTDMLELAWDAGECWRFGLELKRGNAGRWAVAGVFRRGAERMDVRDPLLVAAGFVFAGGKAAPLDEAAPFDWIALLRGKDTIEAREAERDHLLAALLEHPTAPPVAVPEELRYEESVLPMRACLRVHAANKEYWNRDRLRGELSFDYDGRRLNAEHTSRGFFDPEQRRFLRRDAAAEEAAKSRLAALGLKFVERSYWEPPGWNLAAPKLPGIVRALVAEGWQVEAEGKTFRRAGGFRLEVTSGVDWFELHGEADYGEASAQLPDLLAALRKGENMVRLDDGTYGLLPEEWMARFGALAGMGALQADHVRFRHSQAGLLDALLAAQPEARFDEGFARARRELREFAGVAAAAQPDGFAGQLRDYQREGLGWMQFLRRFGFGGCLADDMGLGKTAQVLALLEARRQLRGNGGGADAPQAPSLAVVPKSLVFNWKQEAARFTPQLKVLDHTGLARSTERFQDYDLVLTTYGTLRRDVLLFQDFEFDYVVLDEAQAIKNADTESAKAARLLRGRQRLALSGTPVENHLGELWSLFEFLNPGLLGSASVFKLAGGALRNPDAETRALLACALRPFMLRRTKEQVARELPPKTEQTIYCEMEPQQRRLYDELKSHYRNVLLGRIDEQGLAKSKMHVLEALLRLRQAACHPGLLDPKRAAEPSAKLDVLLHRLEDVLDEGHKALVFSQFTSLLAIVRRRLDARGVPYEYLDGQTRDRQQRVERFQDDPACPLFLVSLKAGGLGLNLTAAEYVFLLDPWWNPAVEAQAIDRTHRIGQTRQVFAYRLIARDTVEEKVLELQSTKRDLAAAIIGEDNSLIRDLRREDLELLLS